MDATDFESLLVSHQNRIYYFIRSMVFNPEDARDVLQDINAIIIRKRDRFTAGSDFKSWCFAIARFECLAYFRKHRSRNSSSLNEKLMDYLSDGADAHSDRIDSWLNALAECRKLLDPDANRLLDLRYETRVPLEDIAVEREVSEGSLKQKLFRIRNQLKDCVLKRLYGNGDKAPTD